MSGGVWGRRFALHHLQKKIPRRRAQLRGAKARTARYMRRSFSQKKDSIPSLLKYFLDHLRLVGGLIPPRTLCGKSTPQGRTLCGRLLLLFGGFGFRILGSSPFPPSVGTGSDGGPRLPVLSPLVSSFKGSGQGATSSIFSNTRFSKPSGRGAKHRIIFAFVSQSWSKSELSEITP